MNKLIIDNQAKYVLPINKKLLLQVLDHLTTKLKLPSEVNLIIVNSRKMRSLYKKYIGKDKTTDVLSFPNEWKSLSKIINYNMLGDIFINWQRVISQAKEYGHSEKREFAYLFAHGLLHLLGYDHIKKSEEKEMNRLTEEAMMKIGVLRHERNN